MNKLLVLATLALPLMVSPAFADEPKERSEIPAEFKWDLSSMYSSNEAWEADREKFQSMLPEIGKFKGRLADNGETLLAAITKIEEVTQIVENLYVYAGLSSFEDLRVGDNSARFSEAGTLLANLGEETAFFGPELLSIPEVKLAQMIDDTPGLDIYRHSIDETLRLRAYTLSESGEKILAAASDPLGKFGNTYTALNNADMTFGEINDEDGNSVELTKARYGTFIFSPNRQVREDAWKGLFKEYERLGNTLAANYEGHVKSRVFLAKTRGYDSRLQEATYSSAIPEEVYINLIKVSREGSEPLQRYLELRRKSLGVDTLEVWDLYAPLVEPTMKDISWGDAKKIVADALQPLGPEYVDLYWKGFDEGWVDVYETKGKRGGAFSWGTYSSKPYLSMNYEGTLNDVSTLAHEYGHSVHSYLSRRTQPYTYGSYRTFIAEIASMTNEAILYQKLLKETKSRQEKTFLLQTYLDQFRGSFFRQASFADFEMQAHALVESGSALTKESLNDLYADVFSAYYGDAVNTDPLNASEWSRIPHFLRTDNFYVYQYATSFAAATALAKMILEEGEPARKRFLTMLRSGSNDYPIELLKKAGVDMTTPQPIYDTLAVFEELVNELALNLE
jgi:oligoendopeptidase F